MADADPIRADQVALLVLASKEVFAHGTVRPSQQGGKLLPLR